MTDFGFPSRYKIKKTDDFSSVFNFRKRIAGHYLVIHYMPTVLAHPRMGLIVGKKLARSAVQRNYMKRVLREQFRLMAGPVGGVDILVRPQQAFSRPQFAQVEAEFRQLMRKLGERIPSKQA